MIIQDQLEIDHTRPELEGFQEYYATRIAPTMAAKEEEQRSAQKWAVTAGSIGLATTGGIVWLLFPYYDESFGWPFFITISVVVLSAVISLWKIWSLQSSVKAFLLKQVSEFFEFEYREKARLANFNDFSGSGLLPNYSTASTEDHFRGDYHGVEFEFFECSLSQKQGEDSSKEVYHGVLFCFSFPKSFSGETIVLKDQGKIRNLMKGRKQAGERVELEDPRFEKRFEVWGTDPTETRYLLTPTLMERIVELAGAFGSTQLELCLKNNHLLLSVHVTKDQFEGGGMFESVKSKKRVETLVNEITRLFDIVNTLKLNLKTRV
jgi:hypothetical protein